jgi:hypothetical protein
MNDFIPETDVLRRSYRIKITTLLGNEGETPSDGQEGRISDGSAFSSHA